MSGLLAVSLAVMGLVFIALPVVRVRLSRLRLGSRSVALSGPVDFTASTPALLSTAVGVACLAAALVAAGLPERLLDRPEPTATPDSSAPTGIVAIRLLKGDAMAGYTVADSVTDFEASVSAESPIGPIDGVSCLALRVSGEQSDHGESYRASGSTDWPLTGYMFCASQIGLWAFSRFDDGAIELLRDFRESEAISASEANVLAVSAEGDTFVLSINGTEVDRVQDATYGSGRIQIVCGSPPQAEPAAVCRFDAIDVRPVP